MRGSLSRAIEPLEPDQLRICGSRLTGWDVE
jgi:hypothetical protein